MGRKVCVSCTFRVLFKGHRKYNGWASTGVPDDRHTMPSIQQSSRSFHGCWKQPHRRLTLLPHASEKHSGLGNKETCFHKSLPWLKCNPAQHTCRRETQVSPFTLKTPTCMWKMGTLTTRDFQEDLRLIFLKV